MIFASNRWSEESRQVNRTDVKGARASAAPRKLAVGKLGGDANFSASTRLALSILISQ
jgi:hypothetical protein